MQHITSTRRLALLAIWIVLPLIPAILRVFIEVFHPKEGLLVWTVWLFTEGPLLDWVGVTISIPLYDVLVHWAWPNLLYILVTWLTISITATAIAYFRCAKPSSAPDSLL